MRGIGTVSNGVYPGYIRRVNEGVVPPLGVAGATVCLWQVRTNDTAATVEGAGFFNAHADALAVGSVILASMDVDGTPVFKIYMVTANDGSTVTIARQTTTAG